MFRFLKDFWPAILGGLALFFTPLGGFVRGLIGIVTTLGPKLFGLIAKYPVLGAAAFAAGAVVPKLFPQTVEDDADKQANEATKEKGNEQAAADIRAQNENRSPVQQFFDFITGAGQEREEQADRLETGKEKRYGFFGN